MGKNRLCAFIIFICLFCFAVTSQAYPQKLTEDIALRILIGEASNQGLKGMVCVAEVLRRRGSAKGFRGYTAKHINREPKATWMMAKQAWEMSAHTNYTNGADHFANVRQFPKPFWVKACVKTYQYKDHVFYKHKRA